MSLIKSRKRVADHGEVFTPAWMVDAMLELADNIVECRANLLEVFADSLDIKESDDLYRTAFGVLSQNLVHGDALTMQGGETGE